MFTPTDVQVNVNQYTPDEQLTEKKQQFRQDYNNFDACVFIYCISIQQVSVV